MESFSIAAKISTVVLLLYALIAGLLIPLKPGIVDVKPDKFQSGAKANIEVFGYNTLYTKEPTHLKAFLKLSGSESKNAHYLLQSENIEVESDTKLKAIFNLPEHLPGTKKLANFSLIIDHPSQGSAVIPGKIIISQDSMNAERGNISWTLAELPQFHAIKTLAFPYRNILYETIRNTFYHVSLWFAMFLLFGLSVFYSFRYLRTGKIIYDQKSAALVVTGIIFGLLGCATGSLWAKYTWDAWWTRDIKLNMAALTMLIYFSYLILRASIEDHDRKARISAAYNIFALASAIPLIFILPRLTDSLHPGNGGNPAFGGEDLDHTLRIVFYPAVVGFMLLGLWISHLLYRVKKLEFLQEEKDNQ